MDDLLEVFRLSENCQEELQQMNENFLKDLRIKLWGQASVMPASVSTTIIEVADASPIQTKKRRKRLSSLLESQFEPSPSIQNTIVKQETLNGSSKILEKPIAVEKEFVEPIKSKKNAENVEKEGSPITLMPPPLAPVTDQETSVRPTRAAKQKSEKNLKEPSLIQKMRRPSKHDSAKIKIENQQRASQIHDKPTLAPPISNESLLSQTSEKDSILSLRSTDSVVLVAKEPSVVVTLSDDEQDIEKDKENTTQNSQVRNEDAFPDRQLCVKIKRERLSNKKEDQIKVVTEDVTISVTQTIPSPKELLKAQITNNELSMGSNTTSNTCTANTTKKGRKKKMANCKPIKVERFSDIDSLQPSPISSRTRKGSTGREQQKQQKPQKAEQLKEPELKQTRDSVYEDAVENLIQNNVETPPTRVSQIPSAITSLINETVTVSVDKTIAAKPQTNDVTFSMNAMQTTYQVTPGQTTFIMDNQNCNSTVTLVAHPRTEIGMCDATFDVGAVPKEGSKNHSDTSAKLSMETARDTSQPPNDSLITEDESFAQPACKLPQPKPQIHTYTAKALKMPSRTHELFNPLIESPVKKKVQAFENAAHAAANTEKNKISRLKHAKENAISLTAQPSNSTPLIGKLIAPPALGRFLTPTQATNITPNASAIAAKKGPNSASKAVPFPKTTTASNLKATNSMSTKTLSRENSADEIRKGLQQMVEERKKQREQKHLLAAQLRETKERERAERMAKLAQEREEKRIKKQQEAEQKKRELEDIQRKLRQQEEIQNAEAIKLKAAKSKAISEQERELLMHMKPQGSGSAKANKMLPPPPKMQSKYIFEMLHEDDSTDDESKVTHKRPPPPLWSQSHVRGAAILMQQYWPTDIIDSFFSVQPMTPDLKQIFPNIDARHLKRNSSAFWSTPPRYSELPKY